MGTFSIGSEKLDCVQTHQHQLESRFALPNPTPSCSKSNLCIPQAAHPSPPTTPQRMRTHRGHRHTQSLVALTPCASATGLLTPPSSFIKSHRIQIAPPSFLTTPTRCKPTLAMSVYNHPPSPLRDTRRSPSPQQQRRAYSSRPTSPTPRRNSQQQLQEHVPRPPSRSEKLLRDTLIRDELERNAVPPLPVNSRHPSYSCESGCSDDFDEEPWVGGTFLFRTPKTVSGPEPNRDRLVRTRSTGHVPQSPPHQAQQRHSLPHYRAQTSPTPSRQNLQRNAKSLPTAIPISPGTSYSPSGRSRSHSRSHSHSISCLPAAASPLTPHEAVLRSRLEKVLSMGREEVERDPERRSNKRRSGDGDKGDNAEWLWNSQDWISSPSPSSTGSNSPSPSRHTPPPGSPRSYPTTLPSPTHALLTPPDSPAFNARTASVLCRQIQGYVSFANVEGLGEPPVGIDEDVEEDGKGADRMGGGVGVGDVGIGMGGGLKLGLEKLWKAWGRDVR